ncbi:MAG: C40 family peptidase [Clostridia bacterium]|nr:C40 family peptidase [Clostridia bacterium]
MNYFKRFTATIVAVCICLSTLLCTAGATEAKKYGIVTASLLNLRSSASTSSTILAQIPNNQTVSIEALQPGWAKVTYYGTQGFVSLDYLKVMSGENPTSRNGAVSSKGQAVVELAKKYLGIPYVYGGSSPSGFDCSGFVYFLYKNMGVTLNRVAADQMTNGTWVPKNALQPGDIVGFANRSGYINHVGIYVGNGMMIHSPQTGEVVRYESIVTGNYANRLTCGRRIFN